MINTGRAGNIGRMPTTINGLGTWHWGRSNRHEHWGRCAFCGAHTRLQSYDTTLYFVVAFLPVLPLGRKRVIDHCPSCNRMRIMKLREWDAMRDKAMGEALQAYQADRTNREKAIEALRVTGSFRLPEAFAQLVPAIVGNIPGDAELHALIGDGFVFFDKPAEAEAHWRQSLQLKDDPNVRKALAGILLRNGRPAEADPLFPRPDRPEDLAGCRDLYLLVEGYQAQGMHSEALDILDEIEQIAPSLAADAAVVKYRRLSQKHKASGRRIASKLLALPGGKRWRMSKRAAVMLWMGILALAVTAYLGLASVKARGRMVYLVNGLEAPCEVTVNGRAYSLGAGVWQGIELDEGEVLVEAKAGKIRLTPQRCTIATPFFTRPFLNPTFVINPDRLAVIYTEQLEYSTRNDAAPSTYELHSGKLLFELNRIDFAFIEPPREMEMKGSKRVKRTAVNVVRDLPLHRRVWSI